MEERGLLGRDCPRTGNYSGPRPSGQRRRSPDSSARSGLEKRLKEKNTGIELTPAAKVLLATLGNNPAMRDRPLRRTSQREVEDQLSESIQFGEVHAGDIVADVDVDSDEPGSPSQTTPRRTPGRRPNDRPPGSPCRPSELLKIQLMARVGGFSGGLYGDDT